MISCEQVCWALVTEISKATSMYGWHLDRWGYFAGKLDALLVEARTINIIGGYVRACRPDGAEIMLELADPSFSVQTLIDFLKVGVDYGPKGNTRQG